MKKSTGVTVYDVVISRIEEMMSKGIIPWRRPWTVRAMSGGNVGQFFNAVSKHSYRGINNILLSDADDYAFMTFKQITEKGGHIRKGSHSFPVVFWKVGETKDKKTGETKKSFILRYYKVFRLKDIEGIDEFAAKVRSLRDSDLVNGEDNEPKTVVEMDEQAEQIVRTYIEHNGPKIERKTSNRAFYSPSFDQVVVPAREQYPNSGSFYSTLFHELVHSTGHKSRLDRKFGSSFGNHDYSVEELVAEIGSSFLLNDCGLLDETLENNTAYIQNWLTALKNDKRMIIVAASQAVKAVDWIKTQNNDGGK